LLDGGSDVFQVGYFSNIACNTNNNWTGFNSYISIY